jgi:hypothetical protein
LQFLVSLHQGAFDANRVADAAIKDGIINVATLERVGTTPLSIASLAIGITIAGDILAIVAYIYLGYKGVDLVKKDGKTKLLYIVLWLSLICHVIVVFVTIYDMTIGMDIWSGVLQIILYALMAFLMFNYLKMIKNYRKKQVTGKNYFKEDK